jgi:hypothetical protein
VFKRQTTYTSFFEKMAPERSAATPSASPRSWGERRRKASAISRLSDALHDPCRKLWRASTGPRLSRALSQRFAAVPLSRAPGPGTLGQWGHPFDFPKYSPSRRVWRLGTPFSALSRDCPRHCPIVGDGLRAARHVAKVGQLGITRHQRYLFR